MGHRNGIHSAPLRPHRGAGASRWAGLGKGEHRGPSTSRVRSGRALRARPLTAPLDESGAVCEATRRQSPGTAKAVRGLWHLTATSPHRSRRRRLGCEPRSEMRARWLRPNPSPETFEPVGVTTEASCSGASRVSREGEAAMADYHEGTLSSLPARIVPTCCGWGRLSL